MGNNVSTQENTKLFNKYFIMTWFVSLTFMACQLMLNNAVSLYVDSLGYGSTFTGIMAIPFALLAIFARFAGGGLCDAKSRRLVLVLSCTVFCISTYLFGIVSAAWALILFRSLHGLGFAAANTAASTASVDVVPQSRTAEGIGYFWAAQALANGSAGYLVVALVQGDDYSRVFNTATLILAVSVVLSLLNRYEKDPKFKPEKAAGAGGAKGFAKYFEKRSLPAATVMLCITFGTSLTGIYTMLFAAERGYSSGGTFFLLCAVCFFLGNVTVSRLTRRFGRIRTFVPAVLFFDVGLLLMGWTGSEAMFLMAGAGYGLVQGICYPILNTLVVEGLPFHRRGVASGTLFVALDVGVGVGSFLWGGLIDLCGFRPVITCAAIISSMAVPAILLFFGKKEKAAKR